MAAPHTMDEEYVQPASSGRRADPNGTMAGTTPASLPHPRRPRMTSSHPPPAPCQWFSRLASALDRRSAPRLARARRLLTGVVRPLLKGAARLTLALDDTPSKRYGPHVH